MKQRFLLSFITGLWLISAITGCGSSQQTVRYKELSNVESQNLQINQNLPEDTLVASLVKPYRVALEEKMNVVIGAAAVALKEQRPEGPLNNFVADLMRERASREMGYSVDIALTNLGGLRSDIPEGPITLGKVYEVMPFENELVVLSLSGEQIRELAREIADLGGEAISGMRIKYSNGQLTELTVGGETVQDEKKYSLATSDYLSSPGRKKLSVLGSVPRNFIGVTIRQAIIDHIMEIDKAGEKISTGKDGRIQLQ